MAVDLDAQPQEERGVGMLKPLTLEQRQLKAHSVQGKGFLAPLQMIEQCFLGADIGAFKPFEAFFEFVRDDVRGEEGVKLL